MKRQKRMRKSKKRMLNNEGKQKKKWERNEGEMNEEK